MKYQQHSRARIIPVPSSRTSKRPGDWEMKNGEFVRVMERVSA